MIPNLSSLLRSGLIALGVAAGVSAPAFAVPIAAGFNPAVQPQADAGITLIQDGRYWRRHRGDGDRWRSRRHWRDGDRWRDRRHFRRNWRRYDRRPSIYLDFSFPGYRYYEPRYYAPRYYAPRRVYRSGRLSSAHVRWCYDRYRSYRPYDNTFQPYNGPRRQCWSPYS
ncbi:BA14K family protein [Allomesorhizobium camelthorni]|uniref:Lectin-like protein BA14k n=1 Tax=Allomesorhizobium camelthorni TaxID=475069 RepID=A0A6G4W633_9HYPH|nr:BA14K family protein [Mesorhizobium camelthorni]NGO50059.1 BA14K family protein [Mesorhizobium camelthorni]